MPITTPSRPVNRRSGASAYRLGAVFQRTVAEHLRAREWFVVISGGSLTVADIIAIRRGVVLIIQCKRTGRLDPAEWNALVEVAQTHGVHAILARQRAGAVEMLRLTGPRIPYKRDIPAAPFDCEKD